VYLPTGFAQFTHGGGSDTLKTAIDLFSRQLQICIREGNVPERDLTSVLSTLTPLDPFQTTDAGDIGFSWVVEILNSSYPEDERYRMASTIVKLLGKYFYSELPERDPDVDPTWMLPLIGFLSLCEKFYSEESPPYPGFITLRILSTSPKYPDIGAPILPILASILLPTHPIQSRSLALKVFYRLIPQWFSSQMENVSDEDLQKLLRAVGDPFQFTPDIPFQTGQPAFTANYEPIMAAIVLIEFASSDLWRNHLHRSNFVSCDEIMSTEKGKRTSLKRMLEVATYSWLEFLRTPMKIITAVGRLEELQCSNVAEAVIMWAWTAGIVDPTDHDGWRLITNRTLQFCRTNGMEFPTALKRHITK
jgi:hypothetical protein